MMKSPVSCIFKDTPFSKLILAWLCYVLLIPAVFAQQGAKIPPSEDTDQIIIKFRSERGKKLTTPRASRMSALSTRAGKGLSHHRVMSGEAHVLRLAARAKIADVKAMVKRLMADPDVEYAEPDLRVFPTAVPNDPGYGDQWNLKAPGSEPGGANLPGAWDITTGASSVVVAVLDSGILTHQDISPARILPGYDMVTNASRANDGDGRDNNPSDPGDWEYAGECGVGQPGENTNSSWHGTHVAGIIGAATNNGIGIAGINWSSKILPVRVFGKCTGYSSDLVDGIYWAAGLAVSEVLPANPNPAKAINMSLGGFGACPVAVQEAIDGAISVGASIIVSAGNANIDASGYSPSNCNGVITVAATNRTGGKASYSNYGSIVKIAAPGGVAGGPNSVLSTFNSGATSPSSDSYAGLEGTSQAAPHVSGIVSLMLSVNPTLTPAQVLSILSATARTFPTGTGSDCTTETCGAGIVNAAAALAATPLPAPAIASITPTSGINDTSANITNLAGTWFVSGATVKLTKSGQADINATDVTFVNATQIICTFPINGAATGAWTVVVTNPDAQSGSLTNGFMVVTPPTTNLNPYISQLIDSEFSVTWDNISGADYSAVVSTNSNFIPVLSSGSLSLNTTSYTGLSADTTYYFEVKLSTETDPAYVVNRISVMPNHSPTLAWTGEENYIFDGLNPETDSSTATFVYRVKYTDSDNNAPANGYPKLYILKSGTTVQTLIMNYVSGANNTGAIYSTSAILSVPGTDYSYHFAAYDVWNATATGEPTEFLNAPDVIYIPTTQLSSTFTARTQTSLTASWTPVAGADYVAVLASDSEYTTIVSSVTQSETTKTFNSLSLGTSYYFQVKISTETDAAFALNRISTITISISAMTIPTGIYFDDISSNSITASGYAAAPFIGLEAGLAGVNVAINGIYSTWRNGNVWTSKTAMPTPRYGLAVGVIGRKLYAIGGSVGYDHMNANDEYDPTSNTWVQKAAMPTARRLLSAGVIGGKLYAVGQEGGYATNEEYDPASNTWATKTEMPTSRYSLSAGVIAGKLYAIGGLNEDYEDKNEEYDPTTNTWATKAAMPMRRGRLSAGVIAGKLYAVGGSVGYTHAIVTENAEYNPAANVWSTKAAIPAARANFSVGVIGGKLYAVGGDGGLTVNEEYDPTADTWTTKAAMPTPRVRLAVGVIYGKLYAVGGDGGYTTNEEYDPGVASSFAALLPNTQYSFKSKARDADGVETTESPTVSTYTLAVVAMPVSGPVFTGVFGSSIAVNWSSGTAAGGFNGPGASYKIQISTASDFSGVSFSSTTYNLQFTTSGLLSNTTYYFRAQAYNTAGVTDYSLLVLGSTQTKPGAVNNLSGTALSPTAINWSWDAIPGVLSYNVYQASDMALLGSPSSNSFNQSALSTNTAYGVRIAAMNSSGEGPLSDAVTTYTLSMVTIPVSGPMFTDISTSSITVNWSSGTAAGGFNAPGASYEIQVSTAYDFSGVFFSSTTYDLQFTTAGLSSNTTYYFRAQAYNTAGVTDYSWLVLGSTQTIPGMVNNLTGTALSPTSINWSWDVIPGVISYNVYRLSDMALLGSPSGNNFNHTALSTNTAYGVRVAAVNSSGEGPLSDAVSTYTLTAQPVAGTPVFTSVGDSLFILNWLPNENPASTLYRAQISESSSFTSVISSDTYNSSATFTELTTNTLYYARVAAINGNGIMTDYLELGAVTAVAPATQLTPVFTALTTTALATSWADVPGTAYIAVLASDSGYLNIVSSVTRYTNSKSFTGLSAGERYYFQVKLSTETDAAYLANRISTFTIAGTWSSAASMATARNQHTETLLPNGKVLITGGNNSAGSISSAEVYDQNTNVWSSAGSMSAARAGHTATLLSNGRVLITGGTTSSTGLSSTEIYNPDSNTWSNAASMSTVRYLHTATLLPNEKVLITGGTNSSGYLASAEIYDSNSNTWLGAASMSVNRSNHTATLLLNGNVLVVGRSGNYSTEWCWGGGDPPPPCYTTEADIYDPNTNVWLGTLNLGRASTSAQDTATLLYNGKVLITGGAYDNGTGSDIPGTYIYDPNANVWSSVEALSSTRYSHTSTLLPNGKVLVTGGHGGAQPAEIYNPSTNTWSSAGYLSTAREKHTSTLLPNGKVLVTGGQDGGSSYSSSELFSYSPIALTSLNPAVAQINFSSLTATWASIPDANYTVVLSSDANFMNISSSVTQSGNTKTFLNLLPATRYYLKVKLSTEAEWAYVGNRISSTTFTIMPGLPEGNIYTEVHTSSLAVNWSSGTISSGYNPADTLYTVEISTTAGFNPVSGSSLTYTLNTGFIGLTPNTTYYSRIAATYYGGGQSSYLIAPATITLTNPPADNIAPVLNLNSNSFKYQWSANDNPFGTAYTAQRSTATDFTGSGDSSTSTINTYADFSDLTGNTIYYARTYAVGRAGYITQFNTTVSTVTPPQALVAEAFSAVASSAITANWGSGTNNTSGLTYLAQISVSNLFTSVIASSVTANIYTIFGLGGQGTPLTPNTTYYGRVQPLGYSGAGSFTDLGVIVTLANSPLQTAAIAITSISVNLDWLPNGNPEPGTIYELWRANSPEFTTPVQSSISASDSSINGLSPSTTYYFKVRTVSKAGTYTVFDSTLVVRTHPTPPAPIVLAGIEPDISAIKWAWNNVGAEAIYKVVNAVNADLSGNLATSSTFWVETQLSTNTAYTRKTVVSNISGASTSTAVTRYTLAASPSSSEFFQVYRSSVIVQWSGNSNPPGTSFEAEYWTPGGSTTTLTVNLTSAVLTGLVQETTVYARVRAINGDGLPTAYDLIISTYISSTLAVIQTGSDYTLAYNQVLVNILPGTFDGTATVLVKRPDSVPPDSGGLEGFADRVAVDISAQNLSAQKLQPLKDVTLTMDYNNVSLTATNEDTLVIATYNETRSLWVPFYSIRNKSAKTVTAKTGHFSLFQLMYSPASGNISGITVGPNPLRPIKDPGQQFTFRHLPSGATVKIYTYLGEVLSETVSDASGLAVWDGRNKAGRLVASDIYLALIEWKGKKKIFKLVVEK